MFGPFLEVVMSKKCTALWREACLEESMVITPGDRATFGPPVFEKVHGIVARSAFGSNVKT